MLRNRARHVRADAPHKQWISQRCGWLRESLQMQKAGLEQITTVQEVACPTCGQYFTTLKDMRSHHTKAHKFRIQYRAQGPAGRLHTLRAQDHSVNNMPICRHCNATLNSWHNVRVHVLTSCPVLHATRASTVTVGSAEQLAAGPAGEPSLKSALQFAAGPAAPEQRHSPVAERADVLELLPQQNLKGILWLDGVKEHSAQSLHLLCSVGVLCSRCTEQACVLVAPASVSAQRGRLGPKPHPERGSAAALWSLWCAAPTSYSASLSCPLSTLPSSTLASSGPSAAPCCGSPVQPSKMEGSGEAALSEVRSMFPHLAPSTTTAPDQEMEPASLLGRRDRQEEAKETPEKFPRPAGKGQNPLTGKASTAEAPAPTNAPTSAPPAAPSNPPKGKEEGRPNRGRARHWTQEEWDSWTSWSTNNKELTNKELQREVESLKENVRLLARISMRHEDELSQKRTETDFILMLEVAPPNATPEQEGLLEQLYKMTVEWKKLQEQGKVNNSLQLSSSASSCTTSSRCRRQQPRQTPWRGLPNWATSVSWTEIRCGTTFRGTTTRSWSRRISRRCRIRSFEAS